MILAIERHNQRYPKKPISRPVQAIEIYLTGLSNLYCNRSIRIKGEKADYRANGLPELATCGLPLIWRTIFSLNPEFGHLFPLADYLIPPGCLRPFQFEAGEFLAQLIAGLFVLPNQRRGIVIAILLKQPAACVGSAFNFELQGCSPVVECAVGILLDRIEQHQAEVFENRRFQGWIRIRPALC